MPSLLLDSRQNLQSTTLATALKGNLVGSVKQAISLYVIQLDKSIQPDKATVNSVVSGFINRPKENLATSSDSGFLFNQNYSAPYFAESYVGEERIF